MRRLRPGKGRRAVEGRGKLAAEERDIVSLYGRIVFADAQVSVPEIVGLCRFLAMKYAIADSEGMMEALEEARSAPHAVEEPCARLAAALDERERFELYLELCALAASDEICPEELALLRGMARGLRVSEKAAEAMEAFLGDLQGESLPRERGEGLPYLAYREDQERIFGWRFGGSTWLMPIGVSSRRIAGQEAVDYRVYGPFEDGEAALAEVAEAEGQARSGSGVDVLEAVSIRVDKRGGGAIVRDIDLRAESGKLTAIMGPAGSGKSTLLKALLGLARRSEGKLLLNGQELPRGLSELGRELGYVPQDDLLYGELTVFENLKYRLRLVEEGRGLSLAELDERIDAALAQVGLSHRKLSPVGSEHRRILSGGERRRLNIAMELVNSPRVLLLDEPTSGLSSQDAADVVALLKRIAVAGTMVVFVIHQPSSSIYELFDAVVILGKDGTPAYRGDPLGALELFQEAERKGSRRRDFIRCPRCDNLQPDILMRALKAEGADFWRLIAKASAMAGGQAAASPTRAESGAEPEARGKRRLGRQFRFQFERSLLSRIRDRSLSLITLLGSPLLGFACALAFQYRDPEGQAAYSFAANHRYPQFLFMSVIAAIFLGLTASCSEISKDRPIIMRERLSGISMLPGFAARLLVLTFFAIAQAFLFLVPAHLVLGIPFLFPEHLLFMSLTGFAAAATGLALSAFMKSRTAAQNLIPVLCLAQILLGGGFMKFSEMGAAVWIGEADRGRVPPVAQLALSRWSYEMIATAEAELQPYARTYADEKAEWARIDRLSGLESEAKFDAKDLATAEFDRRRAQLKAGYNDPVPDQGRLAAGDFLASRSRLCSRAPREIDTWVRDLWVILAYSALVTLAGVAGLYSKRS
jgi:ABC-type multidrug transport system ATPase subunit/uncharacterized tellurite resistance protein B-like protein